MPALVMEGMQWLGPDLPLLTLVFFNLVSVTIYFHDHLYPRQLYYRSFAHTIYFFFIMRSQNQSISMT